MKYFLLTTLIIFSGCAVNVGGSKSDEQGANINNELFDPDYYYELDTWGTNADVFEFTPKGNPDYICINVGGNNSRSIDCIPKKDLT